MEKVKKHTFLNKAFGVIFSLVALGLMIAMADLFSSLITVGGFSFVSDNINFAEYRIYAVCTSKHQTKVLANEFSDTVKGQGGAGYLLLTDGEYYIVASMYETETDAKKVLANIIEAKPEACIKTIVIPPVSLNNNLIGQEKSTITNCLSTFKTVYKKLYDISVSLDTAVTNEVNARLEINEIHSSVQNAIGNFDTIFANNTTTSLLRIKLGLQEVEKYLNDLKNSTVTLPFTSYVKECYCRCIISLKNTCDQI